MIIHNNNHNSITLMSIIIYNSDNVDSVISIVLVNTFPRIT